ncbi:MAG: sodium:calcium symporter [Gemmatimonas sp.]|uniref:sodium:calcium symporter n=1 Tax=Gemmatimonas sp. TaxID=1962908 RepID=UPI00391EEE09|nr:sodium:calcium symporter [Gemmatimonadota bacterium]
MSTSNSGSNEAWGSRIGLILAMAGNAVGLGNFLRFPRQAAANGGGSYMIAYFIALLLLGIPLMWIEWGVGRNGGRYRKGHLPGMFAAIWKHPLAKYCGVVGMVVPLGVMIYYTYIESWTLAFAIFSATKDYWGQTTQEGMIGYLRSFQGLTPEGGTTYHASWTPYAFFTFTLAVNIYILSRGISGGIEKLAKIGMPILFIFAIILAGVVLTLPPQEGIGATPLQGLEFIYKPDLSRLGEPGIWLAAAGQIFFTLSVGMGSLQAYASYLSTKDDIALNGIATASTNETAEVVLGGSIAIPAAVTFFGVAGAMQIAQGGSFDLGFATMPVVFQQIDKTLPIGNLLGVMWFGLLFFAGITSSVAMLTPITAFFREEFGFKRETVAWSLGGLALAIGMMHVTWLGHGFLDEWDYWVGTFGLVLVAVLETVVFIWIFKPDNAWKSIHMGADINIPKIFKFIMTYVTPLYLFIILTWWGKDEAIPILLNQRSAGSSNPVSDIDMPYITISRGILVAFVIVFLFIIRTAWKRNGYDDRKGFVELPTNRAEV